MNDNTKALSKEFYFVFTCQVEAKYPSLFFYVETLPVTCKQLVLVKKRTGNALYDLNTVKTPKQNVCYVY